MEGASTVWSHPSAAAEAAGPVAPLVAAARHAIRTGDAGALEEVCRAIGHLSGQNEHDDKLTEIAALVYADAPAVLVAAVHQAISSGHAGVLRQACWVLGNIATGNNWVNQALARAGAFAALVAAAHEAVRVHDTRAGAGIALCESPVVRLVCRAFMFLAEGYPWVRPMLVQAGAPAALVAMVYHTAELDDEEIDDELKAPSHHVRDVCALRWACEAIGDLAACGATALVHAGAPAALVAAEKATRSYHWEDDEDGEEEQMGVFAKFRCCHTLVALVGQDGTKVALVHAGAHETIYRHPALHGRSDSLVALAGPDATWATGAEPLERVIYRIRITRASFEVPDWAERHARTLSAAAAAYRDNGIPLAILAKACVLANGDELAPIEGWQQGPLRVIGDRLLESAERAVLERL